MSGCSFLDRSTVAIFFFLLPSNALCTVNKELACCTTASLCNSIKILTVLQPYLTLELLGPKRHNKLLEKRIEFVFCALGVYLVLLACVSACHRP